MTGKMSTDTNNLPPKEMSRSQYISRVNKFKGFILIFLLCSFAVFVGVAIFGGISKVVSEILSANLYLYLLAFVSVFASFMIRFGKWSYYLRKMRIRVPWRKSFAIYFSLSSMNLTPGRVGRVVAGYTLNKVTNTKFMEIAPIITMDIFSDFFGFAIIAIVAAFVFHKFFFWMVICAALLSITFMFLLNDRLYKEMNKVKILRDFLRQFASHINTYYSSQGVLGTPITYVVSFCFTVPADLLNCLALYFTLLALGVKAHIMQAVFVSSVAQMFGMVSTIPGSIGVADATIVGLLRNIFNLSAAISSSAAIMSRLATLWFGIALGVVFLIYTIRYWNIRRTTKT
jgi:uncharacterized protein (TIRG00374 family)